MTGKLAKAWLPCFRFGRDLELLQSLERCETLSRASRLGRRHRNEGGIQGIHMEVEELLKEKREEILEIAARHGARKVRVFGSVAREEAGESSDIDLLVDMEPDRSLLDVTAFLADIRELLGRRVDVVSEKGLYWLIRRRILKEAKPL
jgi:uncharacterized protein